MVWGLAVLIPRLHGNVFFGDQIRNKQNSPGGTEENRGDGLDWRRMDTSGRNIAYRRGCSGARSSDTRAV